MPVRLHQLIAGLAGIVAAALLLLATFFPVMLVAVTLWGAWLVVLTTVSYRLTRWPGAWLAGSFTLWAGLFYTILDWPPAIGVWLLITAAGTGAIMWWQFLRRAPLISFQRKPWRRVVMMCWVVTVAAAFGVLAAWHMFFPMWPTILLSLAGALVAALAGNQIWLLYQAPLSTKYWGWTVLLGLAMFELISVVLYFLPLGYFASALLLAWLWYIAQLFIRFYESRTGIIWYRQRWFLVGNAIALAALLYIVRLV